MQSSPPFGASVLDLPAVTVADRVAAGVVLLAGPFLALVTWRHGPQLWALLPAACSLGAFGMQVHSWTRSSRRPPLRLVCAPDGNLQVQPASALPVPARLRAATRRIGPSVFLDVEYTHGARRRRIRRWLSAWDVPADALRRLTVVLPGSGRAACS